MPLLDAIAAQSLPTLPELNRQELAMTAWAFATLGIRAQPLFTAISAAARQRISAFGMLELSNLAWAFSRLAERDGHLMEAISAQSLATHDEHAGSIPGASGTDSGANPNGAYSLMWSAWKAVWPELSWALFRQPPPQASGHETLVYGVLLMDREWVRDSASVSELWQPA